MYVVGDLTDRLRLLLECRGIGCRQSKGLPRPCKSVASFEQGRKFEFEFRL